MTFKEILAQIIEWLQHDKRLSYRALKRQFDLDDAYLEDVKLEIIEVRQLAIDQDGTMLVWTGEAGVTPQPIPQSPQEAQSAYFAPLPAASRIPEAERRQLTVMFCDLVDSTVLSGRLDPEDLREVVQAYQATCAEVIHRFDGYVAQYLGDGLLVYFGFPHAHEDDAQRAVRAGLRIVEAMGTLNASLEQAKGVRLAIRLGIHTGLVVVGAIGGGGRQEHLALGETPNIAARLQGLAAPNTVAISAATLRLVQGYFTCQDISFHSLKGVVAPVQIYHVLGESGAQSRLDVAGTAGLTPLVGRESEMTLLLERWVQSKDGPGQVVLLSGEAGIGKSRLVQALRERVRREGGTRVVFHCSAYYTNSVLYPVIEHLQRLLQWRQGDTPTAKLDKLERLLSAYRFPIDEVIPWFASLLSVPLPDTRYPPLNLSPQRQKQQTYEALVAWLVEEAERQPVLAVWEDLHWADPSTMELLSIVIDQAPTARMLTLLTFRPEFRPPWTGRSPLTQITLNRLSHSQVEAMVTHLTGGKTLPAEVVEQVIAKTDGVPLFVEELLKMILESGLIHEEDNYYARTGPLSLLAIPSTLHDSLMARLDRLAPAKAIAQLGAVLGREFMYEVINAVARMDETALQQGLVQLVDAELLYQRGHLPHATYLFKHALIQDAAYQSLLKSTRQQYHQRIAQVLEARFPETVETQPELLAYHFTEADVRERAVSYWLRAGQRASERSAYVEAISHLTKGLELVSTFPDTPERAEQELGLQTTLGASLEATKGWAAPEVGQAYAKARELCQHLSDSPQLFQVFYGLWAFYLVRAELQMALQLAERLLSMAQRLQDSVLALKAHFALATTLYLLGDWASGRMHTEQSITLCDLQQYSSQVSRDVAGMRVYCLIIAALTLLKLGYPDQALQRSNEALSLAQELSHPFTLAWVLWRTATLYYYRREDHAARERVEAAIALSTAHGFPLLLAGNTFLQGRALAVQGRGEEGLARMRQGLAAWRGTGAEMEGPSLLALLAEVYSIVGQADEGLHVLADALALVDEHEERSDEAELHRLKGELLLSASPDNYAEAERCFHQALDIARRRQGKWQELRSAMSLSRLWQRQGMRDAARQLLAEVYNWFTEGFDTADLRDAKTLLEELG